MNFFPVLVIRLVSEAGLFELALFAAEAILGVLLGGVRRLGCSLGLGQISTGCLAPLPLAMLLASAALYALEPTFQGPSRTPAALAVSPKVALSCLGGGSDLPLALRVDTKLGTL